MTTKELYACVLSVLCFATSFIAKSEIKLKPGEWQTFYSYNDIKQLCPTTQYVFALTDGGIFYLDKATEEIRIMHKSDGISSGALVRIDYIEELQSLICVHSDLTFDMYNMNSGAAYTETAIKNKDISGKVFRDIKIDQTNIYIATDFGIVKYDARKKEVADNYTIGNNGEIVSVSALAILGDTIYAATGYGDIRRAAKDNRMLSDYNVWTNNGKVGESITGLEAHRKKLVCLTDSRLISFSPKGGDTTALSPSGGLPKKIDEYMGVLTTVGSRTNIYKTDDIKDTITRRITFTDAVYDPIANKLWAGQTGLLAIEDEDKTEEDFVKYLPDGPAQTEYYSVSYDRGRIIMAYGPGYSTNAVVDVYNEADGTWHSFNKPKLQEAGYKDYKRFMTAFNATLHPKDPKRMYVPTWRGVFEFYEDSIVNRYTEWNSTMIRHKDAGTDTNMVITEKVWFDKNGYMFCTNTRAGDLIHCMSPEGKWEALQHQKLYGIRFAHAHITTKTGIEVILVEYEGPGVIFLDMKGTPDNGADDDVEFYSSFKYEENGQMETFTPVRYYSVAEDRDGALWVGTDQGPIVFKNVKKIFDNGNTVVRPKITREDDDRYADYLLSADKVNAIAVDGSNRKWMGTEANGLYLVSEDGTEILENYTINNSILPSNKITSLYYRGDNGYLYVLTDAGLCIYATDSTEPSAEEDEMENITVFPNPLRPEHDGGIEIRGLMADTEVRITDMRGSVIVNSISNGGTFRWDAKTADGSRVATGVYNIFVSTKDGMISKHLKVAVVK